MYKKVFAALIVFCLPFSALAHVSDINLLKTFEGSKYYKQGAVHDLLVADAKKYSDDALNLRIKNAGYQPLIYYKYKNAYIAKEMIKTCHAARKGMKKKHYSPVEYAEAIKNFNRQAKNLITEKATDDEASEDIVKLKLGALEYYVRSEPSFERTKSFIRGANQAQGYQICQQFKLALSLAELGQ